MCGLYITYDTFAASFVTSDVQFVNYTNIYYLGFKKSRLID